MNASRRKVEKDCLVSQRSGSLSTYTTACMLVGIEAVCGVDQFLLQVTDLVDQFLLQLSNIDCSPHIYIYAFMLVVFEHDMCGDG